MPSINFSDKQNLDLLILKQTFVTIEAALEVQKIST